MMNKGKYSEASLWKSKTKSNTFILVVTKHFDTVYFVFTKNPNLMYFTALNRMCSLSIHEFRDGFKFRTNMKPPNLQIKRYLATHIIQSDFMNIFSEAVDI